MDLDVDQCMRHLVGHEAVTESAEMWTQAAPQGTRGEVCKKGRNRGELNVQSTTSTMDHKLPGPTGREGGVSVSGFSSELKVLKVHPSGCEPPK